MAASAPTRVALVGRGAHLSRLESELGQAEDHRARVVLLTGEAGAGKTRLAADFVAQQGGRVIALSARAYPLGATASLGLWVEALERTIRTFADRDLLELCDGRADDLAALLPSVSAAAGIQPHGEPPRIRLLGALASLLQRLAARAPVVVTLDDVHLGDGSSWEALNYLSRNLNDSRLLILLAARPDELQDHPLAGDVVRALEQEGLLSRITVGPLQPDDVRDLAGELLQGPVPPPLVEWLVDRAQGSPLFVTGLVRALLEEGADLARPSLRSLPESLAERVQARIRVLNVGDKATLELLTVIGYRVEISDLLRLTGRSLEDMGAILERLLRVRLVAEIESGQELLYEIAHPLIQEAIYGQIGGLRRRALHRHAARVLVEAGRYGAAASHVVRAADPGDEEAIQTLCEALRRAEVGEHHREALALLEALLTMLPAGDERWLRVVGVMPLTPEWVVDHRADARADIGVRAMRRVEPLLERTGDLAQRAAVKFSLGSLLAWGMCELEAGRQLTEAAQRLFIEAGEHHYALLVTNELGYQLGIADDGRGHERVARDVLLAAETSGDQFLRLQALCSLAWTLTLTGRLVEALSIIELGIDVAATSDKVYRRSYLLALRASIRHLLGEAGAGDDLEAAKEINPAFRDTLVLDFTAQIGWESGDLQAAVAAARDQRAWSGGISTRRAFGTGMAVMSLAEMGRHDEAAELQAVLDQAFRGQSFWALSRLAAWSRSTEAALATGRGAPVEPLLAVAEEAVQKEYWCWGRWMLADVAESAAYRHNHSLARRAHDLLTADPWLPPGPSHQGLRYFVAGAVAVASGEQGQGTADLERAVSDFRRAGWRLFEGRALALHGTSLARADRTQALQAFEQAAALFDQCGATVRRGWVLADMAGLGSRGRRKKGDLVGPDALSPREREVARLASQGCSAREIAARLFIGERTVETHLANAYAKLGVASKLDLIRRAGELGV
jgi:DNA-binding CsgD family transcriptional regulator